MVKIVVAAGLTAAFVEMLFVLPIQGTLGVQPAQVFRSIASGALGRRAFDAGAYPVFLGISAHILISLVSAAVFLIVALRWSFVRRHWVLAGVFHGVGVYVVMNFIVIPLSAIGFVMPKSFWLFLMSLLVHIFAFSVPIALVCKALVKRYALAQAG